jgi:hypothetical protein
MVKMLALVCTSTILFMAIKRKVEVTNQLTPWEIEFTTAA